MTAPRHVDVGAYVLGILDEPDERAYERHFARCEQCRREFVELADLPALLDSLKPDQAAPPPPELPPFEKLLGPVLKPKPGPPPAVPPQQRPNGATQPHTLPRPHGNAHPAPPAAPSRTNGNARPSRAMPGQPPQSGSRPGLPPRVPPAGPSDSASRIQPARPAPGATPGGGSGSSARMTPAARPGSTPASASSPRIPPTGSTSRSGSAPAKPSSKPRDPGPAGRAGGRRDRKPIWLSAAAVVAAALTVGVVIGWPSGDGGTNQVANPTSTAPATPPSGAVAGAHVVSGTDPDSGASAIITIEPVPEGTEIEMVLYQIDSPQNGELVAVSRFGDREVVATWSAPADDTGEGIRASGVLDMAQQDINRFELHGEGIEPLLVIPT